MDEEEGNCILAKCLHKLVTHECLPTKTSIIVKIIIQINSIQNQSNQKRVHVFPDRCTSLTFVLSDVCLTFVPSYNVFRADVCTFKLSLAVQCTVIVKFKMIIILLKDNSSFNEVGSDYCLLEK